MKKNYWFLAFVMVLTVLPLYAQEPNTAYDYSVRGNRYYNQDDYDRAIADFNNAIRIDPNYAYAYRMRGYSYSYRARITSRNKADRLADMNNAIADLTQAIRLEPNNASAYRERGYAYRLISDFDRAIADLTQAIRLEPNAGWYQYYCRGYIYAYKGEANLAIQDFEAALRIDPNNSQVRKQLEDAKKGMTIFGMDDLIQ